MIVGWHLGGASGVAGDRVLPASVKPSVQWSGLPEYGKAANCRGHGQHCVHLRKLVGVVLFCIPVVLCIAASSAGLPALTDCVQSDVL